MAEDDTRAAILLAVVKLRHACGQPAMDRGIAQGMIGPEIRRLEAVIAALDAHHATLGQLVAAAATKRRAVDDQLAFAVATLQRIMQLLGPAAPTDAGCAGCAAEIAAALDALHVYGIRYREGDV